MSNEKIILLSGDLVCLLDHSLPWYLAVSKTTSKQKQGDTSRNKIYFGFSTEKTSDSSSKGEAVLMLFMWKEFHTVRLYESAPD